MDNQEFENIIAIELSELSLLNENAIKIARNVIGETLFKTDLYFCSMLNKSLKLTDGFIDLVKKEILLVQGFFYVQIWIIVLECTLCLLLKTLML